MQEEIVPVSFPCVVEISHKLGELDKEGVEDPEEGEESPSGVVVVEEVEDVLFVNIVFPVQLAP